MENNKNDYKVGIFAGIGSAVTWGIDTVLMVIVLAMFANNTSLPENAVFLAPVITAFFHDAFSAVWTFIYLGFKKQLGPLLKAMKTKSALFVALAALLGGPVGMTGYVLAVKYIGPSYTAIISSLYPAFGAVLAYFVLKEKMTKKGWIGLLVAVIGICWVGYSPNEAGISIVGFIWVIVCVAGWGSESVICAIGMKNDEVSSEFALQIRQLTSGLVYAFLIIPIIGGVGLSIEVLRTSAIWWVLAIALSGTLSYLFYYQAIYKIGPVKAMGLNITYVVFSIAFDILINGTPLSLKTIICSIMVMGGVYFVAKTPETDLEETPELVSVE
jgi:drug/metabolite transporter (DMT)-like permease